jgi:hypothetical protein
MPVIIPAGALRAGDRVMAAQNGSSAAVLVVLRMIETGPHGHIAHLDGISEPVSYCDEDLAVRIDAAGWAA